MQDRTSDGESEYVPGLVEKTNPRGHRDTQRNTAEVDRDAKNSVFTTYD